MSCQNQKLFVINSGTFHARVHANCLHPRSNGSVELRDEAGGVVAVVLASGAVVAPVEREEQC